MSNDAYKKRFTRFHKILLLKYDLFRFILKSLTYITLYFCNVRMLLKRFREKILFTRKIYLIIDLRVHNDLSFRSFCELRILIKILDFL